MSQVNTLLTERLKKNEQSSKMAAMAKQSTHGNRTGFAGIFSISELSPLEKENLVKILTDYQLESNLDEDLHQLISLTSEVKAINNQAAILHGERIKKAHVLLKKYRDGAFTAWLIAAYGNRQTPYNFLQYYLFCESMPKTLRTKIEEMPRQAIYTLASREGPLEKKQEIVKSYNGETKFELLTKIRTVFPLSATDKRQPSQGQKIIKILQSVLYQVKQKRTRIKPEQKAGIKRILEQIHESLQ